MTLTQPLRDEHAELIPHVDGLAEAGDAVGRADLADLRASVNESYEFLTADLVPHAGVEEAVVYPLVQRVVGAPEMTASMERDHAEVRTLTAELGALREQLARVRELDTDLANGLRRVLYGLHHVVKLHFAKEEEVFLPILDARLTESDAEQMFADIHRVGSRHHTHA